MSLKALSIRISFFLAVTSYWVLAISCSNNTLGEREYINWVEDYKNGLHVEKATDQFIFDLQYQPPSYILLQKKNSHVEYLENDNLQHYILTIRTQDKTSNFIDYRVHDFSEKQRKLYYFSYMFQNDISVEEDGKTIPCVLSHFERLADLKQSRTFVLAFEKSKEEAKETYLVINSDQFGSLPVKIKVSKENIPSLTL